ncbi:MAG: hypothetical protein FWE47_04020 [Oscillospiraceae bacterium]|nr:hypothetical protein [Oscillospiraceae bacterium]
MKKLEHYALDEIKDLLKFDFLVHNQKENLNTGDLKRLDKWLKKKPLELLFAFVHGTELKKAEGIENHTELLRMNIQHGDAKGFLEAMPATKRDFEASIGKKALAELTEKYLEEAEELKERLAPKGLNTQHYINGIQVTHDNPTSLVYK